MWSFCDVKGQCKGLISSFNKSIGFFISEVLLGKYVIYFSLPSSTDEGLGVP